MNQEQSNKTIQRLQAYAEVCKQRLNDINPELKAFFERDLKRTLAAVAKLRG